MASCSSTPPKSSGAGGDLERQATPHPPPRTSATAQRGKNTTLQHCAMRVLITISELMRRGRKTDKTVASWRCWRVKTWSERINNMNRVSRSWGRIVHDETDEAQMNVILRLSRAKSRPRKSDQLAPRTTDANMLHQNYTCVNNSHTPPLMSRACIHQLACLAAIIILFHREDTHILGESLDRLLAYIDMIDMGEGSPAIPQQL